MTESTNEVIVDDVNEVEVTKEDLIMLSKQHTQAKPKPKKKATTKKKVTKKKSTTKKKATTKKKTIEDQVMTVAKKEVLNDYNSKNYSIEPTENNKFLRHALGNLGLPPIDISDPKQVEERIFWYFNKCADDDVRPTVAGMQNSLGINHDTLWMWKTGGNRKSTHQQVILKAYSLLDELWEHYMMNGKINPVSGIYLGKVMFGHNEEQHIKVTATSQNDYSMDAQMLEQKYAQLPIDDEDVIDID